MAYVPPALRRRQEAGTQGEKPGTLSEVDSASINVPRIPNLPSIVDIQNHFWPTNQDGESTTISEQHPNTGTLVDPTSTQVDPGYLEGAEHIDSQHRGLSKPDNQNVRAHSTLNSTQANPNELRYVLLFHDAHPRWKTEYIIYVKSELQLLPTKDKPSEVDLPENTTNQKADGPLAKNILFFQQDITFGRTSSQNARFQFDGYYNLIKMELLEPKSPELARMLEQKWTRTNKFGQARQIQRDAASWKKSFGYRWAVLKFEKNEGGVKELGVPKIEISQDEDASRKLRKENDPPATQKGVNELLKEMRLGGQSRVNMVEELKESDTAK